MPKQEISLRKTTKIEREFLKGVTADFRRQKYTFREIREIKIKALIEYRKKMKPRRKNAINSSVQDLVKRV